ncbi:MAG: redoxin domain-containing protein [Candidatus Zixiibacteriota bacterium]|nr:MAG: redoxin domain-containing protein [candidate division Zixibacteria bacterium]
MAGNSEKALLPLGQKAPYFELEAYDGGRLSLANLKGKFAVIVFYPKNNTPG